jgi:hypothetical protein
LADWQGILVNQLHGFPVDQLKCKIQGVKRKEKERKGDRLLFIIKSSLSPFLSSASHPNILPLRGEGWGFLLFCNIKKVL